jgi:rRNA-processing protein FCF1
VLCETYGWTCVTNDAALSKACSRAGVPVRRGLSLMIELTNHGHLDPGRALSVARAIREINPFITDAILEEFEALLPRDRPGS